MTATEKLNDIEMRLLSPMVTYKENATEDAPKMLAALRAAVELHAAVPTPYGLTCDVCGGGFPCETLLLVDADLTSAMERAHRYDQCDDTCTVDCGHCKGAGRPVTVGGE